MPDYGSVSSKEKYHEARWRAMREDWLAALKGESDNLIPFETIAQILQAHEYSGYTELRSIPLDHIVGSVGRYRDFTRTFMPRAGISADRWSKIDQAINSLEGVPPIDVFQVGDVYFVADGNHRVSVARASGFKEIDAYVTVVATDADVCLEPGDTVDQAIIKAGCSRFIAETGLAESCCDLPIQFTRPGGYSRLLNHVEVHQYFMSLDNPDAPEPTFQEAARDWYDKVYRPIADAIERHALLEHFPGTTAADLYVWVSARILELHQLYGQEVSPDEAASLVAHEVPQAGTPFSGAVLSLVNRLASKAVEAMAFDSSQNSEGLLLPGLATGPVLAPAMVMPGAPGEEKGNG